MESDLDVDPKMLRHFHLYVAAFEGNLPLVQEISLDPEIDINRQGATDCDTPFYLACKMGRTEIVRFMLGLERLLDVNLPDIEGWTPLFAACYHDHVEIVSLLLADPRVDMNKATYLGETPLFIACVFGQAKVVRLLMANQRVDVNRSNHEQATPFLLACDSGDVEVVKLLLADERVDVSLVDKDGLSPIYVACQNRQLGAISLLLADKRFDPSIPDNKGCTPFSMACAKGCTQIVSLLLADERVDPNFLDHEQSSPFLLACHFGCLKVVSLLLADKRIDLNKPSNNGSAPLWCASHNGHYLVVSLLLASGRELDTQVTCSSNNTTAAEEARLKGRGAVKRLDETLEQFRRREMNYPKIADLLDSFERNPQKVRADLRQELNGPLAGELFALVIYVSDGYLQIQSSIVHGRRAKAQKFFSLAVRLPLDLQMTLCNQVFGLGNSVVKRIHSENGFRKFAKEVVDSEGDYDSEEDDHPEF